MILLVVVRTVPALASHNGSTDQLTIAELMTEQKPRCLTGAYWLFRMPMVILSLVWLFPPTFLKNCVTAGLGAANRGFCKGGLRTFSRPSP